MNELPNWGQPIKGSNFNPNIINNSHLENPLENYSNENISNVLNEFSISNNQNISHNVSNIFNRKNIASKIEYLKNEFEYNLNQNKPLEFIDNIFIVKYKNKMNTQKYVLFEFFVKSESTQRKKLYGHLTFHEGRSTNIKGAVHYVNESRISSPQKNTIRLKRVKNSILKNIEFKFMKYDTDPITRYILEKITPILEQYYLDYELSE
jgi:hypothetical protein